MQKKIPILSALLVLTTILAIPLATHTVRANVGLHPTDAGNNWIPYGPTAGGVTKLQFTYFSDPATEFTNFELGKVDVVDWESDFAKWAPYDANPDFLQTPAQGQFGDFGIYFNGGSSTWALWGCSWNTGTPFTSSEQTYVTACGNNMRQAFSHLIDRGTGTANRHLASLQCPSPAAKIPSCAPATTGPNTITIAQECAWDTLSHSCIDAFRQAPSGGDWQQPVGSPDFCDAADHMIAAGIASGKAAGTCVLTGVNAGVFAHPLRAMIRSSEPRKTMGNQWMAAVNALMGGPAVTPTYGGIQQIGFPIVFSDPPVSPVDDWDMYTYGYGLPGPFPDHMFGLYNGAGATNYCGGVQAGFPDNAQLVCNPTIDADTAAASTAPDVATFNVLTLKTFDDWGKAAIDIPAFASQIRTVGLRSVKGLVNSLGNGYNNGATLLYAQKDGAYVPANPIYAFGGGDDHTLRYGQASGTSELNVYNAQTVWEFQTIGQIYDTLFSSSPIEPGNVFCWMCSHYDTFNDAQGNQHFVVYLRQDLRWQDGVPVDAYDVKFSFLNLRDFAANAGGALFNLLDVKVLDSRTVDVKWLGSSISYPVDMETFIIPRHIWELAGDHTYGDVGTTDPAKLSTSYDPLSSGTLIGSGAFVCVSVFGSDYSGGVVDPAHPVIGKGCAQNADGSRATQSIGISGKLLLQAYNFVGNPGVSDPFLQYMRTVDSGWGSGSGVAAQSGQFNEFSYADHDKNAVIGEGNIADLASVAACFGKTSSLGCADYAYWQRNAFETTPGTISGEVAIVAAHYDDAYVQPFTWSPSSLVNIVPYP